MVPGVLPWGNSASSPLGKEVDRLDGPIHFDRVSDDDWRLDQEIL
jgi:hypothetical protein